MKRKTEENIPEKLKKSRKFDFDAHPRRKIAIQFLYHGWEYDGLVQQPNTENTVEQHLMNALIKTHLINDWSNCDFSRSGRTDKGVSAFKQTAAMIVRSICPSKDEVFWEDSVDESVKQNYKESPTELNYIKVLNGVLPKTIRVFSCAFVSKEFNARFDCNKRVYKYSIPRARLDINLMSKAAKYLIGEHDFSNFCQIDMNKKRLEQSYIRKIYNVSIAEQQRSNMSSKYDIIEIKVEGSGFLWHMIRFIVSVLYEVGRGNEEPEIVQDLLDLSKFPSRPQYNLASCTPLCLHECCYDNSGIQWNTDQMQLKLVRNLLQKSWASLRAKCSTIENMIKDLGCDDECEVDGLDEFIQDRPIERNYVKYSDRPRCESLESKRQKLKNMTI